MSKLDATNLAQAFCQACEPETFGVEHTPEVAAAPAPGQF